VGTFAEATSEVLKPVIDCLFPLVDSLYLDLPLPTNDRKPKKIPLNESNFAKKEFQALWSRINHKAVYQVEFDSTELVASASGRSIRTSTSRPCSTSFAGTQRDSLDAEDLTSGTGFQIASTQTQNETLSAGSQVKYDLLGEITEKTRLTRRTAAAILGGVRPTTFAKFRLNPEQFITEAARLTNEQKATVIVEHLTCRPLRTGSTRRSSQRTRQDKI
jgi:type III restriction enzyme